MLGLGLGGFAVKAQRVWADEPSSVGREFGKGTGVDGFRSFEIGETNGRRLLGHYLGWDVFVESGCTSSPFLAPGE